MASWTEVHNELERLGTRYDIYRRRQVAALADLTGRNVILLYSGWLQRPDVDAASLSDTDAIGLVNVVEGLDPAKGLDLVLHTRGGDTAACESIIDYLRAYFGTDMRAIVPLMAMSAGTIIACACRSVLMGHHSNLGPINPQISGYPAVGVVEEFWRAMQDCVEEPKRAAVWGRVLDQCGPTLLGECEKAIAWSRTMTTQYLQSGMFAGREDAPEHAERVVLDLLDHALSKAHNRHLTPDYLEGLGLVIERMEEDSGLHDCILTLLNACLATFMNTPAFRIVENNRGRSFIQYESAGSESKE
jgi:ATP-dependent protease ClpP protease subunit